MPRRSRAYPELIVFDFDRTLVDLGAHVNWAEATRAVREAYRDAPVPPEVLAIEDTFTLLSRADDELRRRAPEIATPAQARAFSALGEIELRAAPATTLMPAVPEVLAWAQRRLLPLAIVSSNGPRVVAAVLERLGLGSSFTTIVARAPGLRLKPHPDQLARCLEVAECRPSRALVVGDSVADMRAARALRVPAIGVLTGISTRSALRRAGARAIIEGLAELPACQLLRQQPPRPAGTDRATLP